jgi:uncharacterized protein (TIGR03067 family)
MRRVLLPVLLLSATPAVVAAPAPFTKAKQAQRTDVELLQGEWVWRGTLLGDSLVVITPGRIHWHAGSAVGSMEGFRLNPTTNPKAIDLTRLTDGSIAYRGIYKLERDLLTIRTSPAGADGRPTSFDAELRGDAVYVLHRKR